MPNRPDPPPSRRDKQQAFRSDSALLRILVSEATRRNWTLARLAKELGISYERLAQYRRADADIATATRETLQAAATLLDIPLAGAFVLAGRLAPADFLWPSRSAMRERLQRDLDRLAADPLYAAFVDEELTRAHVRVQHLVVLLYREVAPPHPGEPRLPEWLRALQLATLENADAQAALAQLRNRKALDR